MATVTLEVKGMSCNHCVQSIQNALKDIGANGSVDLAGGKVTVEFEENKLTVDKIKETIEDQGYDVVG